MKKAILIVFIGIIALSLILIGVGIYCIVNSRKGTTADEKESKRNIGNNLITIGTAALTISSVTASLLNIKMASKISA